MNKLSILILYSGAKTASNVFDHAESFGKYSKHIVRYLDVTIQIPRLLELNNYDVVVIHHSLPPLEEHAFNPLLRLILKNVTSKKVIFLQDEYRRVNDMRSLINYMNIDLMYTTVPEKFVEEIYPTSLFPTLKKINVLPGFVAEALLNEIPIPYEKRACDVVYRARKLPYWFGNLGLEKYQIGEKFLKDARKYGLRVDISSKESARVYGDEWVFLLKNSKSSLGTEGGAGLYDFTGCIQKKSENYQNLYPEASFEEVESMFFPGIDGKMTYNMLSPRIFECVALKVLLILYEAPFSNILKPWRHYVPLKRDHSNMKEVIEYINNNDLWKNITELAYKEVACNPLFSYQTFVNNFDKDIEAMFEKECSHEKSPNIFRKKIPYANNKHVEKHVYTDKKKFRELLVLYTKKVFGMKTINFIKRLKMNLTLAFDDFYGTNALLSEISQYRRLCLLHFQCSIVSETSVTDYLFKIKILNNGEICRPIRKVLNKICTFFKGPQYQLISSDSWGLPEKIRNKSIVFRGKSYLRKLTG